MVTLNSLQKPQIIDVKGSRILIKHPDISSYPRTFLRAQFTAGGTTLSVGDNDEFVDDDWMIIGERGDAKTEEVDVNGTVTRGTSLTITNTTKFDHEIQDPVTKIYERKITIYGSTSSGGSLTAIRGTGAAIDIAWNRPYTEFNLLTTDDVSTYTHFVVKFYDGTTESAASDYVPIAGNPASSVSKIAQGALKLVNDEVDQLLTWENLIEFTQDAQDEVVQFVDEDGNPKYWSFELTGADDTGTWLSGLEMENRYPLSGLTTEIKYVDGKDAIVSVRVGNLEPLDPITIEDYRERMDGVKRTELNGAVLADATTIVTKDSSFFTSTGSLKIGSDEPAYTSESAGTFSGVTNLDTGYADGRAVWQGVTGGLPIEYTVFDGSLYLDRPLSSTYADYFIKLEYYKKLSALTELSDTTAVTFYNIMKYFIAGRIADFRGRDSAKHYKDFYDLLAKKAKLEKGQVIDVYSRYRLATTKYSTDLTTVNRTTNTT